MDADLEAILAESDSDDAGGEGGLSLEDILKEEDGASSPLQEYRAPQANEESYSARDWAVLQQILREDDDDDDVVEPPPIERYSGIRCGEENRRDHERGRDHELPQHVGRRQSVRDECGP